LDIYDQVIVVEKDYELIEFWQKKKELDSLTQLNVLAGDFLHIDSEDIETLSKNKKPICISSLPYNVSKKILFDLLYKHKWFKSGVFIIQKEVAEDYCSQVPNANFLSRVIQLVGKCDYKFDITPNAFSPQPKVNSSVITIEKDNPLIKNKKRQVEFLHFVKNLYGYKRKTVKNAVKNAYKKQEELLNRYLSNIETENVENKRTEELTIEQLIKIW